MNYLEERGTDEKYPINGVALHLNRGHTQV
jgi:hypothetical protein